jgi:hypothetical protein
MVLVAVPEAVPVILSHRESEDADQAQPSCVLRVNDPTLAPAPWSADMEDSEYVQLACVRFASI